MKESKHKYTLHLTEGQAKILSYACNQFSRLICGQDWSYQELFETAWVKRCKEATGNFMDKQWDGGWYDMRHETEELCDRIKKRYWGLERNSMYGIGYSNTADVLFDLHRVIRHQLWKDDEKHLTTTVDAEDPTSPIGDEPLAVIHPIKQ